MFKEMNNRISCSAKPGVLLVSRNWLSNLTMARAIGRLGYDVEVLRVFQNKPRMLSLTKYIRTDAYSKYIKAYYSCNMLKEESNLVDMLKKIAYHNRKMLLIPTDDLAAAIIDTHMDELKPYYLMPNVDNKPGELSKLMSKGLQKELALKFGIPIVNGAIIRTSEGKFDIPQSVHYPCFVKPNISKDSSKQRMKKCDNQNELEEYLCKRSLKKDIEIVVEDYIEIEKEYSLLGLSTKQGVIMPGCIAVEEGGHGARRGVAMTGKVVDVDEVGQIRAALIKFVASLHFDGLFDIDLIKGKDGKLFFTELNLRFGGSGYAIVKSGANLPGMFADYMLEGKRIDSFCVVEHTGKSFVNEKVLLDECIRGYLTKKELLARLKEADVCFVEDNEDLQAYKHFGKFLALANLFKLYLFLKRLVFRKRK